MQAEEVLTAVAGAGGDDAEDAEDQAQVVAYVVSGYPPPPPAPSSSYMSAFEIHARLRRTMAFHPPLSLKNLYTEPLDILPLSRKDTLALSFSLTILNSLSPSLSPLDRY